MRIAVIADPFSSLVPDKDTTVSLVREALRRGHEVRGAGVEDLLAAGADAAAALDEVIVTDRGGLAGAGRKHVESLSRFDAVLMRKDPPVDEQYIYATHLLSLAERQGVFVMNRPQALRDANEKLYALNFPDFIPQTLVTHRIAQLKDFMDSLGGEMIVKPVRGWGGLGVFYATRGDRNLNAILETATDGEKLPVVAQRYLPEVRQGDKRVILLDGQPLGAVCRVPTDDEHRSNIHVGGRCVKTALDAREKAICEEVGSKLRTDGLYFVGLDLIGGYLTEVNVTSPTGVQEINRLDNVRLEEKVLDFIEKRVAR